MAIKELFYDQRPVVLFDPRAAGRIDARFNYTRDSLATYVNEAGVLSYAGANEPRLEYDAVTGDQKGLFLEKQSTNFITDSAGTTGYSVSNATFTQDATVLAPDRTSFANRLTSTISPGTGAVVITSPNNTDGIDKRLSVFLKAGTYNYVRLSRNSGGNAAFSVQIDLNTGATIRNLPDSVPEYIVNVTRYPDNWYRLEVTMPDRTLQNFALFLTDYIGNLDAGAGTSLGNPDVGEYVYVWGCQYEDALDVGLKTSSYIPTFGTAATRESDLLSVSKDLPTTGSVYIDSQSVTTLPNQSLLSIKNSTNQKIDLALLSNTNTFNSTSLLANYNGNNKVTLPLPVPTENRERNIVTWGTNNYQYGLTGSRFAPSLSSSVPSNLNFLSIGSDSVDPTKAITGYINNVYLWNGELSPSLAEALVRNEIDVINADTFVPAGPAGSLSFVINTQGAGNTGDKVFAFPAASVADDNDIVITWGDQTESGLEGTAAEVGAPGLEKTYPSAGIYSVFVEGQLENIQFANSASAPDLLQIVRWGTTANGNDVFLSPSTMRDAFYGCTQLDFSSTAKTTNLPNTSAVTDWFQAFRDCNSISGIFPSFNFSSATTLQNAFVNCSSLTSFAAVGNQTQNVTNFQSAWSGCSGLTTFPLINTQSGTNFSSAWFGCSSLSIFPAINTSSGTTFGSTWRNCSGLTEFPALITSSGTFFQFTWAGCSNLGTTSGGTFPNIDTSSATNLQYTWQNCSSLTSFPALTTTACTTFTAAWNGCSGLTAFPNIDTSNALDLSQTWNGCSGLLAFPALVTSSCTNFTQTWNGCSGYSAFPNIDTSSGTKFYSAWQGNSGLTAFPALDFSAAVGTPADVNAGFKIAWRNCTSLATFPANLFDSTACTEFEQAWTNCDLTAQSIENILVSINTGSVNNGNTVNGDIGLNGGTNAARSTWSVTAENAALALEGRGWNIDSN